MLDSLISDIALFFLFFFLFLLPSSPPRCSCLSVVGQQEDGLRPLLSRCSHSIPHRGSASSLPRVLLGIHRCRLLYTQTGSERIYIILYFKKTKTLFDFFFFLIKIYFPGGGYEKEIYIRKHIDFILYCCHLADNKILFVMNNLYLSSIIPKSYQTLNPSTIEVTIMIITFMFKKIMWRISQQAFRQAFILIFSGETF